MISPQCHQLLGKFRDFFKFKIQSKKLFRLPPTSPKRYRQFAPPPISMKQSPKICAKTVSCPSTSEVKSPPKKMIIQKIQKHQEAPKPAKVPKIKGEKKKKDGELFLKKSIDV